MKIYTKTGDKGETSIGSGVRVFKDDLRVEAYGQIDELSAVLGVCGSINRERKHLAVGRKKSWQRLDKILVQIQKDLWVIAADLATNVAGRRRKLVPHIPQKDIKKLEGWIDVIEARLPELKNFIVPGGCLLSSQLHFARTVCRRAERAIVRLARVTNSVDCHSEESGWKSCHPELVSGSPNYARHNPIEIPKTNSGQALKPACQESAVSPEILTYINRLSDLLFMMAREANRMAGVKEQVNERNDKLR